MKIYHLTDIGGDLDDYVPTEHQAREIVRGFIEEDRPESVEISEIEIGDFDREIMCRTLNANLRFRKSLKTNPIFVDGRWIKAC